MLAFYLAAPEVENGRRALNVKHGMRRAMKGDYYYYYHAQAVYGSGCRSKADEVSKAVLNELVKYVPLPGMRELNKMVVMDIYKTHQEGNYNERKK
jgi:hypothetical protein